MSKTGTNTNVIQMYILWPAIRRDTLHLTCGNTTTPFKKSLKHTSALLKIYFVMFNIHFGDRGGTVVKVLCYKSEGRWFDSRWCNWNFSLK